jgi:hypothetical protein
MQGLLGGVVNHRRINEPFIVLRQHAPKISQYPGNLYVAYSGAREFLAHLDFLRRPVKRQHPSNVG